MTEPTRINPADIRVGDRVERVWVSEHEAGTNVFVVGALNPEMQTLCPGKSPVGFCWSDLATFSSEWFLLDRPDPLAEVVEVVAPALMLADLGPDAPAWDRVRDEARDDWRRMAREALAAIAERWELVERGKP